MDAKSICNELLASAAFMFTYLLRQNSCAHKRRNKMIKCRSTPDEKISTH